VKLQHYIGGLEGLPEPLSLEPLSVEKRVFVEDWETRIFESAAPSRPPRLRAGSPALDRP
jgi:hypothetical protein